MSATADSHKGTHDATRCNQGAAHGAVSPTIVFVISSSRRAAASASAASSFASRSATAAACPSVACSISSFTAFKIASPSDSCCSRRSCSARTKKVRAGQRTERERERARAGMNPPPRHGGLTTINLLLGVIQLRLALGVLSFPVVNVLPQAGRSRPRSGITQTAMEQKAARGRLGHPTALFLTFQVRARAVLPAAGARSPASQFSTPFPSLPFVQHCKQSRGVIIISCSARRRPTLAPSIAAPPIARLPMQAYLTSNRMLLSLPSFMATSFFAWSMHIRVSGLPRVAPPCY